MATITSLWIVIKPTPQSTLADICFETNLYHGLRNQYRGGLHPDDIAGFYDSRSDAEAAARRLLQREAKHANH